MRVRMRLMYEGEHELNAEGGFSYLGGMRSVTCCRFLSHVLPCDVH